MRKKDLEKVTRGKHIEGNREGEGNGIPTKETCEAEQDLERK